MQKSSLVPAGRRGFTLAEMLVAMALLGVLAAVVVPSILNQVTKGEATRVSSDLQTVANSTKAYYADTFRWPDSVQHLVVKPTATTRFLAPAGGSSSAADSIRQAAVDRWNGPYFEKPGYTGAADLETGGGAKISRKLAVGTTDSLVFVVARGLSADLSRKVDVIVDGAADSTKGIVTYAGDSLAYKFAKRN